MPRSLEIHGHMARNIPIDDVVVEKDKILKRTAAGWLTFERPAHFFGIAAYAPAALQMMLVRKGRSRHVRRKCKPFPRGS